MAASSVSAGTKSPRGAGTTARRRAWPPAVPGRVRCCHAMSVDDRGHRAT